MTRGYRTTIASIAAVAAAIALPAVTAGSAGAAAPQAGSAAGQARAGGERTAAKERKANYDARSIATGSGVSGSDRALRSAATTDAAARLRALVGADAMVTVDPNTLTPANLASWSGYLAGPSASPAADVALRYVRAHAAALGLTSADVDSFTLRKDYADADGTHHLSFTQSARGVGVYGNGLKAHVTKDGRLLALQGAPVAGLTALTGAATVSPRVLAAAARDAAAKDVGGRTAAATATSARNLVTWSNHDRAQLVWFVSRGSARLAWSTYTQAGGSLTYAHVIDAATGTVLLRHDLSDNDRGDALVYDYYPGAPKGGTAKTVNLIDKGWLSSSATWLYGNYVYAWADVNDDNNLTPSELTPVPGTSGAADFTLQTFNTNPFCSARFVCTWNPNRAGSWRANKNADVTNAFYLASNFHDWLQDSSVAFTPAAGNFSLAGGDPVLLNALDGADTADGLPDGNHINNANMSTPPDGLPPTMQMYLWHEPGATSAQDPFLPVSGAFDASILYHEYTHGLSNRLVVDPEGNSGLVSFQDRSMGEAWSDYFAMDYLVGHGFQPDSKTVDGQVLEGKYPLANRFPFRTEAIDCDPDATAAACTQITGAKGGYTYADLPTIGGAPEVHASGEVWAQTLWDLRERLGSSTADNLVARGMELSPVAPTMLDMRNAILQADKVQYAGSHTTALWQVFAKRGMGWFAGSLDAGDTQPGESFRLPPADSKPLATLRGTVSDAETGDPVAGATVTITGHQEYTAVTDADGRYVISDVRGGGTYAKIVASGPGFTLAIKSLTLQVGDTKRADFSVRRDWAASSGGASIADFSGPDYSVFGCGPALAIDLHQGTGWGSTTGDDDGTPAATPIPKQVTVTLPQPVDVTAGTVDGRTAFRVDPSSVCGDPGSSSTNDYRIQVSTDGSSWTTVVDSAFGTIADPDTRGRYFDVPSSQSVAGVRFVRFWMDSPQVPDFATNCPDGAYGGCTFMDMTELQVFGMAG